MLKCTKIYKDRNNRWNISDLWYFPTCYNTNCFKGNQRLKFVWSCRFFSITLYSNPHSKFHYAYSQLMFCLFCRYFEWYPLPFWYFIFKTIFRERILTSHLLSEVLRFLINLITQSLYKESKFAQIFPSEIIIVLNILVFTFFISIVA